MTTSHTKRSTSPLRAYLAEFGRAKGAVSLAILLAAIKHSPVLCIPLYVAFIIDTVIPRRDMNTLAWCVVGMGALIVLNMTLHPLYIRVYTAVRRDVALRLRARLCERLQQLSIAIHDSQQSGRLHSKVMQDVEKVDILGRLLVDPLLITAMTVVAAFMVTVYIQPWFILIFLMFALFIPVFRHVFHQRVKDNYERLRVEQEMLNAEVGEMINMLPLSRAHATEREDLERVGRRLGEVRNVGLRTEFLQHTMGAQLWSMIQLANIATVCLGAFLVIMGGLSLGQMVLAMSMCMMVLGGITGLMGQLEQIYGANEAMRSIQEVLEQPAIEHNEGKPALTELRGAIEFRDVWFAYPGTEKPVLKSLSLRCEPNQTIALVGASGAGKTTMMKLLLGFYDSIQGDIVVDGHSLREIDLRTLRRQVGVVTQDTYLFNGTLWQNLTHGLNNVTREQVDEAVEQAHAAEFIRDAPDGYETEIGDRGLKLSGGQKQRLAIARALLRNPRLLLLDEATSALDSKSERLVQRALETLMRDRTTFVIAHRLSTVRHADRILVFDDGRIVEDGRHDLLISQSGVYARLVELQEIG